MRDFFEDLKDNIIFDPLTIVMILVGILLVSLALSIPVMIFCDFYTKNRALDIYEETGVMITIDSKDIVDITDVVK